MHFVLFTIISTPPNFLWQGQLESWFPSQVPVKQKPSEKSDKSKAKVEMKLSTANTVKKFLTDQLIGAPVNTVLFLGAMGYFRGLRGDALVEYIKQVHIGTDHCR